MIIEPLMSDSGVMTEIGHRIQRRRINYQMTQEMVASEAGVSKRTVERLESGLSVQLSTFIRIIRVLGLLELFNTLLPEGKPDPMELLQHNGKIRERVKVDGTKKNQWEKWSWGDEK